MRTHRLFAAGLVFVLALGLFAQPPAAATVARGADTLPSRLADADWWKLIEELSESGGFFRSDNLLSNELWFQWVIPDLLQRAPQGGVYMGVGPEQNFTYIAALKPKMVFITDVRRGNLHTHLMYKAIFEMSADRAEFVSRLFTKKRPEHLTTKSTATELINAYWDQTKNPTLPEPAYKENLQAIKDHLTKKRGLPLGKEDLDGIEYVYYNFYWWGPSITYNSSSSGGRGGGNMATYGDLMIATDGANNSRSFLASEELFKVLKDLHEKNLFVPLVGNFGGAKRCAPSASTSRKRARPSRPSTCRTSSSTSARTASGTRSAPTSPACRSTRGAPSSARHRAAAAEAGVGSSTRWARCRTRPATASCPCRRCRSVTEAAS